MNQIGQQILAYIEGVEGERQRRVADPRLARRVEAIKRFQHDRFAGTYADLLASPGYGAAARFFLTDLYGPYDFSERDQQFERIVPALVRLFPGDVVVTVKALGELHQVSEELDTLMGEALDDDVVAADTYGRAWRKVGRPSLRERQIELTLAIGAALRRYTRSLVLRQTLRAMRRPATLAGLGALQRFLESGFDAFRDMPDPDHFLRTVGVRERDFADKQFQTVQGEV